jgi:hypothetical protein
MPGMETKLHAVINKRGSFDGFATIQRPWLYALRFMATAPSTRVQTKAAADPR